VSDFGTRYQLKFDNDQLQLKKCEERCDICRKQKWWLGLS